MRLTVEHRTTYRFSAPQGRIVQLLRLTPEDTHDQTVAAWRIDVDCDARMRTHRDGFGNLTTMLYVEGPVPDIEIAVTGEVVTSANSGVVRGASEPLPPAMFLRDTVLTARDAAIDAFARTASGETETLARLHRLNMAVHAAIALEGDRPWAGRTAAETLATGSGTARDLAHLFIAAARTIGVPARYVSGYNAGIGGHRPSPHSWAEAHVAGIGWIGFDPVIGLSPEDHHVRVAVALDAAGAAPVAGSRLGEGVELLDVDIMIQRQD